jgi:transcriptional regulator with XRE-family HTH domain
MLNDFTALAALRRSLERQASRTGIALAIGTNPDYLARLERGQGAPSDRLSLAYAAALADVLGLPVETVRRRAAALAELRQHDSARLRDHLEDGES